MNKDTVVASIIGFGLGLIAAIALWVVPRIIPKTISQPSATPTVQVFTSPSSAIDIVKLIELKNIHDGDFVKVDKISVEGTVKNAQYLVISTPIDNQVLIPQSDGNFGANITLTEGGNEIVVSSYGSEDDIVKLVVYYTEEEI